ncbi:hypothetical protein VTK56DRAFT_8970 [Thermocarpiscus australiensis]
MGGHRPLKVVQTCASQLQTAGLAVFNLLAIASRACSDFVSQYQLEPEPRATAGEKPDLSRLSFPNLSLLKNVYILAEAFSMEPPRGEGQQRIQGRKSLATSSHVPTLNW